MKAIILNQSGGTENLELTTCDLPVIESDEVLVQTKAIGINPVDIKTRTGKALYERLKNERPFILGWDIAGIITQVGNNVTAFKVGDPVFGMVNFPGHGKAYAEYVAAPADHLAIKPANISYPEAAASTLAALTAYQSLLHHAGVSKNQRVLIHAASGGVGHFAIQLAKSFGAYVIGTSSLANRDFILGLGADEHINYRSDNFEEIVSNIDFVFDPIGGDVTVRSLEVTKEGGTVISIVGGASEKVTDKAKAKGIHCYNTMVKSNGDDMKELAILLENGTLKAHVSKTFDFGEINKAHEQIETGHTVGKIVIVP